MERVNLLINSKQLEITSYIDSNKMCNPTPGQQISKLIDSLDDSVTEIENQTSALEIQLN